MFPSSAMSVEELNQAMPFEELHQHEFLSAADLVYRQAARTPESVAVVDVNDSWTYRDLTCVASGVAAYLLDHGIERGDTVAIYARRSAALVPAILGVWKAGGAVLILDEAYPGFRLMWQMALGHARALITIGADDLPEEIDRLKIKRRLNVPFSLAAARRIGDGALESRETPSVAPTDPAYILFTSGTTGRPKGIAVPHLALPHFLLWYQKTFRPDSEDRFSMLSGLGHDPLMRDIFVPLTSGAQLLIPPPDHLRLPRLLLLWLNEKRITRCHLTPSLGRMLSTMAEATGGTRLSQVRWLLFGGEALRSADVALIRRLAPDANIVNCWGASETPQIMACLIIAPRDPIPASALVPIGVPIDDVDLLILRDDLSPALPGETGEIFVRTRYLSQGYIGQQELTEEKFLPNPLSGKDDDLVYRSGDRGFYEPGVGFQFAGRGDSQVKIRGFRVELFEIDMAAKAVTGVLDAAAAIDPDAIDPVLHLFVVVNDAFSEGVMLTGLRSRLPSYMIPSRVHRIDVLPLTPNGKLDRPALVKMLKERKTRS